MKVLLTGHAGYIGTVLTPMLLERGHEVTGLDSELFRDCSFLSEPVAIPCIRKDIRDVTVDDLAGFDAVIHLAGLSNDPLGDYDPSLTYSINGDASIRLGQLAKQAGVQRFAYASSCSNYGASPSSFIDESGAFAPVTPYGESKVNAEAGLTVLADDSFSPTFLRASTAYGLSPRLRFDLVVNNLTAWSVASGQVRMKSDGTPWRPIVHVADIALAYICVIEAERALVHNTAFNVGTTNENFQIRDIAAMINKVVPNSRITFADEAGPDLRNYRVDCNHIARTLHAFKPQWTCQRGIEQLYDAYCSAGITIEDFEGPKFNRIAHVKKLLAANELDETFRRRELVEA